jgi:hypothetical protein
MLFSTIGFSMDIHYCGGEINNVAFFGKAKKCDMMKKSNQAEFHPCHQNIEKKCRSNSSNNSFSKNSCCDNQSYVLQSLENGKTSNTYELASVDLTYVTVFILSNFILFEEEINSVEYIYYSPPLISQDVNVLHQVFLI